MVVSVHGYPTDEFGPGLSWDDSSYLPDPWKIFNYSMYVLDFQQKTVSGQEFEEF